MSIDKTDQPSLPAYCRAILRSWFTAMSGPLSVPAAGLALWVENQTAKIVLGITALVCVWAAGFAVWKRERERVRTLEDQLAAVVSDPVELKRQELVDREFVGFGAGEIEWLQRMHISGRPAGMPDAVLQTLERGGLIDRDFVGATGLKEELKPAIGRALAARESLAQALEIVVNSSSKYRETKGHPHGTTETISIGVRNSHPTRRITNCRISMKLPKNISAYAYLLVDGLNLEAQQEHLVPVAYFHEYNEKTQVRDRIRIPVQSRAGFTMRGSGPELPVEPTAISFEADSTETKPRRISCRIWLDDHRKLQLEQTA